ncbi:MAG TPA: hypothetical protein PKA95_05740 [Thermomicrobiales bacterium]|nr:hypothetical protein [Thermomicrobiales bacterium]
MTEALDPAKLGELGRLLRKLAAGVGAAARERGCRRHRRPNVHPPFMPASALRGRLVGQRHRR